MGAMQFFAPILAKNYEAATPPPASSAPWLLWHRHLHPPHHSAIIGIWEKDQQYFGIGGEVSEKVKLHEYVQIIKNNNPCSV